MMQRDYKECNNAAKFGVATAIFAVGVHRLAMATLAFACISVRSGHSLHSPWLHRAFPALRWRTFGSVEFILVCVDIIFQEHLGYEIKLALIKPAKDGGRQHLLLGVILGLISWQRQMAIRQTTPKPREQRHTFLSTR